MIARTVTLAVALLAPAAASASWFEACDLSGHVERVTAHAALRRYSFELVIDTTARAARDGGDSYTDCSEHLGVAMSLSLDVPIEAGTPKVGDRLTFERTAVDAFHADGQFAGRQVEERFLALQAAGKVSGPIAADPDAAGDVPADPDAGVSVGAEPHPPCPADLRALTHVAPRHPGGHHNEYAGVVAVAITVETSGEVSLPAIVRRDLHKVGTPNEGPIGYDEAILEAVAQWRYPPQPVACRTEARVRLTVAGER